MKTVDVFEIERINRKTLKALVYHSIFNEDNFKDFGNICNVMILQSIQIISLQEFALVSLLKRDNLDDLKLEEIDVWKYIIKWKIIVQNSILPSGLEKRTLKFLGITLQNAMSDT
ncbi:hypothetical protein Glove_52g106 [Diversispora epigaea]|uniref:BACK domain-containing protein n=1 Tax=Diversispora epigaea TaxID=1348612 RepID=A0A397JD78_9GLOM|nr:hypothetical protein Glove_52g106 [Diversispora epigaea]